jgi:Regulator of chromosome condensation (RCC1) repeat
MLYSLSGRASKPPGLACSRIAAGGNNSYFVIDKIDKDKRPVTEVYSAGMGQYGQLGNAMYSQLQPTPVKVKEISNNSECKVYLRVI